MALLLALAEGVARAERVIVAAAVAVGANESVACAELLGSLAVGAADTLAEMVSVSDTSVATDVPVAAAELVAVCVGGTVPRALPVVTTVAVDEEEGERAALREDEGEAVPVRLSLELLVLLSDPEAELVAVPVAHSDMDAEEVALAVARALVLEAVGLGVAEARARAVPTDSAEALRWAA